ncbi:MAG: ATPase, T2SS/T4P/T4SS family, partial [Candidatus Roizmanbacteria bacterium]|nr:ATPase, T2SS/T4P/T4SS family [Candidatus Roizmanbacteria bacterium]
MKISNEKLKEIILKSGFIIPEDLENAGKKALERSKDLGDILIEDGLVSEEYLTKIIAEAIGVDYIALSEIKIPPEVLGSIPEEMARTHQVVAFKKEGEILSLALDDPRDFETIDFIRKKTGYNIKPYLTSVRDLETALGYYKADIQKDFDKIIKENIAKSKFKTIAETPENISEVAQDVPVVKIIDTLLEYAVSQGASDVHIEREEEKIKIRFRIDGVLQNVIDLPKEIHEALVARTKILARLKIDETRLPQDGRFKFSHGKNDYVSLRVSIIPSFYGEDVVMRILQESQRALTLNELGIT